MQTQNLNEARRWMSAKERSLKNFLDKQLRDDGHGHHHAKYADRLKEFDINIIPLDPNNPNPVTASISFETGVINIGEGLINNPATAYQLSTVLRHELAHNLMMHQIRMMNYVGEEGWKLWGHSPSLHNILNIIMDDEISNKRYNDYDKDIMRKLIINGEIIQCLVTEDHRADWVDLPLEEMYERITAELDDLHHRLAKQINLRSDRNPRTDFITRDLLKTMPYREIHGGSMLPGNLDSFVAGGCKINTPNGQIELNDDFKSIVKGIHEKLTQEPAAPDIIEKMLEDIAESKPHKALDLIRSDSGEIVVTLHSPEEKVIAVETLKKYRTDFSKWYNRVMAVLLRSGYSAEQIKDMFNKINAKGNE